LPKAGKSQILDVLLTGPRDPRYGSDRKFLTPLYGVQEESRINKLSNGQSLEPLKPAATEKLTIENDHFLLVFSDF
jgi:hypothetical protein